ncbi:MAG: dephospho-CoA kinase [Clostridia bacterium]|nr:dephospho-CoA kinase [Clostridia bacterium]
MSVKVIGLTGQTGAGKSTVAAIFENFDFVILDADKFARQVTEKGSSCLEKLAEVFGSDILDGDGRLIRPVLAKKAFSSKENTQLLSEITHPEIIRLIGEQIESLTAQCKSVVLDAPQLFESGAEKFCDKIIAVTAPAELRAKRIILRDNLTRRQAVQRIKAQHDEKFYTERADFIINNDGNFDSFIQDAIKLVKELAD